MRTLILDFETYYTGEFSLDELPSAAYVRDQRFAVLGLGVQENGIRTWYPANKVAEFVASVNWADTTVVGHNCIPMESEVLTPAGWVKLSDVAVGNMVMQWDSKSCGLSFAPVLAKVEKSATEMISWGTEFHRGSYTPEHRMYYSTPEKAEWRVATAAQVLAMSPNNVYLPTGGHYSSGNALSLAPTEARLLEAIRADGSVHGRHVTFHLKRVDKIERLQKLCQELGVDVHVGPLGKTGARHIGLHATDVLDGIIQYLGPHKEYDFSLLDMTPEARLALLREVEFWDGSRLGAYGSSTFVTVVPQVADVVQTLAHLSGWTASVARVEQGNGWKPQYRVTLRPRGRAKLVRKGVRCVSTARVGCITVATGAFLVRMGGRIVVTGNCKFDGSILGFHYGAYPAQYRDTLSMAMAVLGRVTGKFSLEKLAEFFSLPAKGDLDSLDLAGVKHLTAEQDAALATYCLRDVEITDQLYNILAKDFPKSQYAMLDWTIRTFVKPSLSVDVPKLTIFNKTEVDEQAAVFARLGMPREEFASSEKFAVHLAATGVSVPKKVSKKTKKEAFAFAKSDAAFTDLLKHTNPRVRDLVAARLISKSTIKATRSASILTVVENGPYPFDVRFSGAMNTHRFSGGDGGGGNPQNFNNGPGLRECIVAPDGHALVVGDFAQIEARIGALGSNDKWLCRVFASGQNPYCALAGEIYKRPIDKHLNPIEYKVGKEGILSLGYCMGKDKLRLKLQTALKRAPTDEEVNLLHSGYRKRCYGVVAKWGELDELIPMLAAGGNGAVRGFPFLRIRGGEIILPSGLKVRYPNLRWNPDGGFNGRGEWTYDLFERGRAVASQPHLYGGKLLEGICQATAGELCKMAIERCLTAGLNVVGQVHDEIIIVAKAEEAEKTKMLLERFMRIPPTWWPQIVLGCEVGIGKSWLEAKK